MSHIPMLRIVKIVSLLALPALAGRAAPAVVPLWEGGAPGFESRRNEPEEAKDYWVRNIHSPSLTVFLPPANKANGCAIVVAPGGGLRELVFHAEGEQAAQYLNSLGVTVFVLKYRLPQQEGSPYALPHVQQDAQRAVRTVRSRAAEFGIDPQRIGMLGFSAGGGVVLSTVFDTGNGDPQAADPVERANSRPNFQMLVYPAGIFPETFPADTPPAWILCSINDEYGCDAVALQLVERLRAAKVPVELHLLAQGKHGFNMGDRSELAAVRHWPDRLGDWLLDSGYLTPKVK